jgi:hypothetical protein
VKNRFKKRFETAWLLFGINKGLIALHQQLDLLVRFEAMSTNAHPEAK